MTVSAKFEAARTGAAPLMERPGVTVNQYRDPNIGRTGESGADVVAMIGERSIGIQVTDVEYEWGATITSSGFGPPSTVFSLIWWAAAKCGSRLTRRAARRNQNDFAVRSKSRRHAARYSYVSVRDKISQAAEHRSSAAEVRPRWISC
jgi:hypothetical protein